jgi:hypothetical protein
MTKGRSITDRGTPASGDTPAMPRRAREERLAAALRANLARRKGQARERKGDAGGYGDKPASRDQAGEGSHDSAGFVADKQGS